MSKFKIGSLFDGSGGFPMAASLCGGVPTWASEVEPYPIAVTRSRFPEMRHLGDVRKVNGAEVEPVDVITFGSPCQDLSVAGKRAGLKHEANGDEETTRSGLFMEAVRIIKEMREATNGRYPNFALWENVPGAFSSNRGEDFRIVLEELIKIVEPSAVMPPVPKAGWSYADCYCGDGWSIAYRTFDAQYWGAPQRRRRIYLVADFRGERAGEVLFERQGLRGYFAEGGTPWKGSAAYAEGSSGADDRAGECRDVIPINTMIATRHKQLGRGTGFGVGEVGEPQYTIIAGHEHAVAYTLKIRSGCEGGGKGPLIQTNQSATLLANNDQYLFQPVYSLQGNTIDRDAKQNGSGICEDVAHTLNAVDRHGVMYAVATQQVGAEISENGICQTITADAGMSGNNQPCICQAAGFKAGQGEKARSIGWQEEQSPTLASEAGGNSVPSVCIKTYDARGNGDGDTVSTITGYHENRVTDYTSVVVQKGFTMQGFGDYKDCEVASGLKARDYKDATDLVCGVDCLTPWDNQARRIYATDGSFPALAARENAGQNQQAVCIRDTDDAAYGVDCRNMYESPELYPTLQAKSNGGQRLNYSGTLRVRYIVRRLTPTECARLQGFADRWGDIDTKNDLTDEEYKFWLDVRNTHAAVNGKTTKEYTKAQILTWYNKLQTDSSEYKMWGNGIALPTALYVMQGIAEALEEDGV